MGADDSRALRLGVLFLYHERALVGRRSSGLDMDEWLDGIWIGIAVDGGGVGTNRSGSYALRFSQRRHRTRVPLGIGLYGALDHPAVHVAFEQALQACQLPVRGPGLAFVRWRVAALLVDPVEHNAREAPWRLLDALHQLRAPALAHEPDFTAGVQGDAGIPPLQQLVEGRDEDVGAEAARGRSAREGATHRGHEQFVDLSIGPKPLSDVVERFRRCDLVRRRVAVRLG